MDRAYNQFLIGNILYNLEFLNNCISNLLGFSKGLLFLNSHFGNKGFITLAGPVLDIPLQDVPEKALALNKTVQQ